MSDERWRPARDAAGTPRRRSSAARCSPMSRPIARHRRRHRRRRLSFGPDDTGPLPHWTDPPTGEMPRMAPQAVGPGPRETTTTSTCGRQFTTETPVWREGRARRLDGRTERAAGSPTRTPPARFAPTAVSEPSGEISLAPPSDRREPGRITIGTDPSGVARAGRRRRRAAAASVRAQRSGRPAGPARTAAGATGSARGHAGGGHRRRRAGRALHRCATLWRPVGVLILIVAVLAVAAFEYFGKVTEKGYRPAVAAGARRLRRRTAGRLLGGRCSRCRS